MTKSSTLVKLVSLMILSMLMNSSSGEAITCIEIGTAIYPCLLYYVIGGKIFPECCNGLKSVVKLTNATLDDRRNLCSCFKNFTLGGTDDQIQRLASVPKQCGVNLTYNISPNVNCSK
ncbi:hypothetical protein M9H77_24381 [Catharanthus roseus]|uniref:Uncharacterized protein n=1 Tax=Catharanthus roseus TaxID=4058 RepID=A0ACC0AYR3_CATRO|nr:hypothetical protein M9H77_24381 [Catharanthus roseus]